ncbi:hypothetical protein D9613_012715 [Agrocybe pediades]|uniref:Uncharacterized protein n=1 Tax=Agrocybe pediades TaxID=84607 RepID=A0A8H4VIU6_9AGAR|nr:hypothetical protein D9613_012715 [Agrocybe pediades]
MQYGGKGVVPEGTKLDNVTESLAGRTVHNIRPQDPSSSSTISTERASRSRLLPPSKTRRTLKASSLCKSTSSMEISLASLDTHSAPRKKTGVTPVPAPFVRKGLEASTIHAPSRRHVRFSDVPIPPDSPLGLPASS